MEAERDREAPKLFVMKARGYRGYGTETIADLEYLKLIRIGSSMSHNGA